MPPDASGCLRHEPTRSLPRSPDPPTTGLAFFKGRQNRLGPRSTGGWHHPQDQPVATLSTATHPAMPSSVPWSDERLDRLAQALLPIVIANNSQPQDVRRVSVNNRTL
jgi:hypothetical protein